MPERPPSRPWLSLLDVVPLALGAVVVGRVVQVWARRMGHPFDLEWMEGGMLGHAWRMLHGLPVYVDPGPDWVPYIYPPGYPALVGALGAVFGLDYGVGRALTVLGTLLSAAAIVTLAHRHAHSVVAGLVGAALFVGSYLAGGAFFDLVRPDMVALAMVAWCVVLVADGRRGTLEAAGLLLAASFLCKHNFAALGVPLTLAVWARDGWRDGLRLGLWAAIPAGLLTLWVQWRTGGWFLVYLLEVPASHPNVLNRATVGMPGDLGRWIVAPMVVSVAWLLWRVRANHPRVHALAMVGLPLLLGGLVTAWGLAQDAPRGVNLPDTPILATSFACFGVGIGTVLVAAVAAVVERRVPWRLWLGIGVGGTLVLLAAVMRAHHGGFLNVLIPVHWAACAGLAMACGAVRVGRGAWVRAATAAVMAGAMGGALSRLEVERLAPTPQDVAQGEEVLATLEERCDGPIFSPYAAWLPVQVGQPPSPPLIALWDLAHEKGPLYHTLPRLSEAAEAHHWACVVEGGRQPVGYRIQKHYTAVERFTHPGRALMPKTGWRVRPTEVLVPRTEGR